MEMMVKIRPAGGAMFGQRQQRQPLADDVGVDAVADGNAGGGRTGLGAFLNKLGLERFGVRA